MDRSNVYSICSYDLNMKLLRIWGLELTNMELSGLLILLPDSLSGGKREWWESPGITVSCWNCCGEGPSGQWQETAQQGLWGKAEDLGDLLSFFPAVALGRTIPALGCSDLWVWGAHLQTPGSHTESLYSWRAEKTGRVHWPPIRPFCSLPRQTPSQGTTVLEVSLPSAASHQPGLVFAVGSEWLWSFVVLDSLPLLTAKFRNIRDKKKYPREMIT